MRPTSPTPPPNPASMALAVHMVRGADTGGGRAGRRHGRRATGTTVCGVGWVGGLLLFVLCCVCDPAEKFSSFSRNL